MHDRLTRRDFLGKSAALATAGTLLPYCFAGTRALAEESSAKTDRLQIGAIGVGERGSFINQWAAKFGDIVAVCDADLARAEKAKATFAPKADIFQDYRKLLERPGIDVIINGTPDHWHTAVNLAALKAKKDIYAEKPLTLTIDEGKILCKAVEASGRIFQVGTMQRSEKQFQTAVELVRNGRIGKLKQVWVALPYYTTKGGPFKNEKPPESLDWELYQGQAPVHDYCLQRTHSVFRWWYEYAGGIITDWGNHHIDIAHWGMDCEQSGPRSVEARALFPNPSGPEYYNTPDRFFSRMLYPNDVEVLYFSSINERVVFGDVQKHAETTPEELDWLFGPNVPEEIKKYNRNGIMFIGEEGRVLVNRGGIHGKPVEDLKNNPLPDNAWRVSPSDDHMANFFDCVKSRKQPCATAAVEHRTITACHLTNISIKTKRKLAWDAEKQEIVDDKEAGAMQKREQRAPYTIES
jgi:predicted dehydrogenase